MKIFVAGATGATGSLLVERLLKDGHHVVAVVRSKTSLSKYIQKEKNFKMVQANLLDLDDAKFSDLAAGCDAVVSCLGHNLTFKGMFGQPRRLVTEATRRLCSAIKVNHNQTPVRFILMNTTTNKNRDIIEPLTLGEELVFGLVRLLLPPQKDNEQAAEYLRTEIGQYDTAVEWVAVRPDSLINKKKVSEYSLYKSPIRSAIFDPGNTSRINVAHFMATLITDDITWNKWKGQMPVIYNKN